MDNSKLKKLNAMCPLAKFAKLKAMDKRREKTEGGESLKPEEPVKLTGIADMFLKVKKIKNLGAIKPFKIVASKTATIATKEEDFPDTFSKGFDDPPAPVAIPTERPSDVGLHHLVRQIPLSSHRTLRMVKERGGNNSISSVTARSLSAGLETESMDGRSPIVMSSRPNTTKGTMAIDFAKLRDLKDGHLMYHPFHTAASPIDKDKNQLDFWSPTAAAKRLTHSDIWQNPPLNDSSKLVQTTKDSSAISSTGRRPLMLKGSSYEDYGPAMKTRIEALKKDIAELDIAIPRMKAHHRLAEIDISENGLKHMEDRNYELKVEISLLNQVLTSLQKEHDANRSKLQFFHQLKTNRGPRDTLAGCEDEMEENQLLKRRLKQAKEDLPKKVAAKAAELEIKVKEQLENEAKFVTFRYATDTPLLMRDLMLYQKRLQEQIESMSRRGTIQNPQEEPRGFFFGLTN